MKKYAKNKIFKKIALLLLVIMICNFTIPNITRAAKDEDGGALMAPIGKLIRAVADLSISFIQRVFTGDDKIYTESFSAEEYNEEYDELLKDFIDSAMQTQTIYDFANLSFYCGSKEGAYIISIDSSLGAQAYMCLGFESEIDFWQMPDAEWINFINPDNIQEKEERTSQLKEIFAMASDSYIEETTPIGTKERIYSIKYGPGLIFAGEIPEFDINFINPENPSDNPEEERSSAVILRSTVSRWYQDLQTVALVGLLSVLVYVAIRMIISSTGKDKSKYKKLLMDWLVAICIVFIIHFIILFILNITGAITDIFTASTVTYDEFGNPVDSLMSDLRNKIGDEDKWVDFYAELIMYIALIIFTVMFTIQYLKRVIYMAFLTMISPLIALTYPLDKIKDGKAQAFSMWIREYIFNALIQPVHLLLYAILVISASELVEAYPLYGVVAIGFLVPAEKFFRSMFGFDKSDSVGTLGAVAGGAAVMSMLKKINIKGKSSGGEDKEDKEQSTTRTATKSPLAGLQNNNGDTQQNASGDASTTNLGRVTTSGTNPIVTNSSGINSMQSGGELGTSSPSRNSQSRSSKKTQNKKDKRDILMPKVKKGLRYAGNIAGGLAFGTIGLAAGVTSGDFEKSLGYMAGGGAAGAALGGRLGDGVGRGIDKIERAMERSEEKHNTKRYGQLGENYSGEAVQKCLDAGVTEPIRMERILSKASAGDISLEEAIAYEDISRNCDSSILKGDIKNFKNYLALRGIDRDESGAEDIRRQVEKFLSN